MLLGNEELEPIYNKCIEEKHINGFAHEVVKAQLKKVVGWLLDNELHPERDGLELSGKSFLSLLDEVKDV